MTKQLSKDNQDWLDYETLTTNRTSRVIPIISVESKLIEMELTITQLQEQLKQAEIKAIEKMIKELCPTGMGAQPDDPPYELTIVWDVFGGINEYLSKLKGEQE